MLLVEDGLTALQSLHAVTVNAAKMLRREAASSPRHEGGVVYDQADLLRGQ